ncbi:MAG: hypothetical protein U1A27_01420 [Phycisphaerae bacterium]
MPFSRPAPGRSSSRPAPSAARRWRRCAPAADGCGSPSWARRRLRTEVIRALARSARWRSSRVEEFAPPALPAAEPVEPDYALNDDQSMAVEP